MGKEREGISVFFRIAAGSFWMGGVNYYRNLFMALGKTSGPRIIPVILCRGDRASLLRPLVSGDSVCEKRRNWRYLAGYARALLCRDFAVSSHCGRYWSRPSIQWIPDFQHVHLPGMFSEREIKTRDRSFARIARQADLVLLSSNDALSDLRAFCPEHASKGRVLHFVSYMPPSVYSETDSMIGTVREKFRLPERYFFLPNQFWVHKNHMLVLEALSILRKGGEKGVKVVCTGNMKDYRNPGYPEKLREFVRENSLEENVSFLGLVDYKEMLCMMRHSLALLQPSLFEGWSSSIEEAKSLGKGCILSDLNVHREQDPARSVYFDPADAGGLAEILGTAYRNLSPGPDHELEDAARKNMESRMREFGNTYKSYVMELV